VRYIHQRFGLFYLDLWTWDGRYRLVSGEQYWNLEPQQAAELLGISIGVLSTPLLYRLPPGLGIVILVRAIFAGVKIRERSTTNKLQALSDDARYQRALDLIKKRTKAPHGETTDEPVAEEASQRGFDDAVTYLTGEGIPDSEARTNLQSMINLIVAAQQHTPS